jgi:Nitrile hydratase, alpha chain
MNQTDWKALNTVYAKAVRKAWTDPEFRAKLLANPRAALADEGAPMPAGVTIKVVENTDAVVHLVLPPRPSGELSEEALAAVAGGANCGSGSCKSHQRRL